MKHTFCILALLFVVSTQAQETYSEATAIAIEAMNSEDSTKYNSVLDLLEKTFKILPDSINVTGLYYASHLATNLKQTDKAFMYFYTCSHGNG